MPRPGKVDRPDRSDRCRKDKDDDLGARPALPGRCTTTPKSKDGAVEALRVLRVTRNTAVRPPQRPPAPAHEHPVRARRTVPPAFPDHRVSRFTRAYPRVSPEGKTLVGPRRCRLAC